jgi:hypothetical protein
MPRLLLQLILCLSPVVFTAPAGRPHRCLLRGLMLQSRGGRAPP